MLRELNIKAQCDDLRMPLWECPHFLFVVMGFVIIIAMLAINITARYYTDPEVAALIVIAVAGFLLVISHIIVGAFERVAEASRARSEFVSIISHQLRNPLSSIRWQLEILLRNQAIDQKTRSYLEGVNEYNNRMAKLVNDLLTVNRIENNRLVLTPAPFSLVDLTKKVIKDNTAFASASHINLTLEEKKGVPFVYADQVYIQWAVENLLGNAIRYSNPRTTIPLTIHKHEGYVRFEIVNNGTTISSEDAQHIFEKFFRAKSAQRTHTDGTGLGLFITKSIVEASDGSIGFNSDASGKTTFWFMLPRAKK
ncbi:MAG: hypothetical protein A3J54_00770 [Candidatus Ryanbacteria bacterium RIFCSPHIGHO2_02_FULL_45_13b]|uniref:histidine kinase n=1 Tax=Candidatus Ryanbacteria bacterium RIFCSPHIGHO2_02_FULL_45_13b TaxID=1802117 RepID=A0A1G2G6R9_9BACT|nr:MAG: hypothetical protein A3J54_00770 [Candidatus Ryanbacteria bacterium RIFCSPHIGHO2_02_FULL_45_13b]